MLKLVIVSCLLAAAAAQYTECGDLQRLLVKAQWATAFGFTEDREALNTEMWREIIAKAPEVVDKHFGRVRGDNIYSPDFKAHAARVIAGFDMTLSMIDEVDTFNAQIAHLKSQHVDLDVDGVYFDLFRVALMNAVQRRVGRCYDHDAWDVCSRLIEDGIKHNKK